MKIRWLILILLFSLLFPVSGVQSQGGTGTNSVVLINMEGPLTPVLVQYLERGIQRTETLGAEALIVQLNTPGGSTDLMTQMVTLIRGSSVPVIVYVAPNGAMAGSAGTIITLAGHAAVMAPETIIGAASPVGSEGEDIGETMEAKLKEAFRAQVRSLAAGRGAEAVALAEDTIENARAVSAVEALDAGLVDFIARDLAEVLNWLEGRTLVVAGEPITLHTAGARVETLEQTLIEKVLQLLTNPNLVFLLLSIGVQAILIEISSPGGWVAGFIGIICVALAIYGLGILPVNWFGLIFLILAFVLFIIDIKAPTHGALTAAGIGSFIAGALILFNSVQIPGIPRISVPLVVGTGIVLAVSFSVIVSFAIRALRAPAQMGKQTLVGKLAIVRTALNPRGQVRVGGELWSAELMDEESGPVKEGEAVIVVEADGLQLRVRKR